MTAARDTKTCPTCGTILKFEDRFCDHCGTAFRKCPFCEAELLSSDRFCERCGAEQLGREFVPARVKTQIDDLTTRKNELTQEIAQLELLRESKATEIDQLEDVRQSRAAQIDHLEGLKQTKTIEVDQLEELKQKKTAEIDQLESTRESKAEEVDQLESVRQTKKAEIDQLATEREQFQLPVERLRTEAQESRERVEVLTDQITQLENQRQRLYEEIDRLEGIITQHRNQIQELKAEIQGVIRVPPVAKPREIMPPPFEGPTPREVPERAQQTIASLLAECQKVVVGKVNVIEDLLVTLLAGGHVLLEGVPGVAKTTIAKTFAHVLGLSFKRIQGSPDILPADIVGTHVLDTKKGSYRLEKGPIFSNILLIDEINRNSPKTNSAVLEAMQEKQVTIEGETQKLPYPFIVIATQSPVEFHGVFPLPEVLIDRFLLSLRVSYPSPQEEIEITDKMQWAIDNGEIRQVVTGEDIAYLARLAREVYIAPQVRAYLVDLVQKTRVFEGISLGASPRASIALSNASRARALLNGRLYVVPDDVKYLAARVLPHRLILSSFARASDLTNEKMVQSVLLETPIPERPL